MQNHCKSIFSISIFVCILMLLAASSTDTWAAPVKKTNENPSAVIDNDPEQLLNQHHYKTAAKQVNKQLKRKRITDKTAEQLLTRIEEQAALHTNTTIQKAYRLSRQNRWAEAENLLQNLSKQVLDKASIDEALDLIKQSQNKKLLKSKANTALQKQSWLHQQYKRNQMLNRSTHRNPISRAQRYWLEFKLNQHNVRLLNLARKSNQAGDWKTAKRCLEAMEPDKLTDKTMQQFVKLAASTGHTIPPRRKDLNKPNARNSVNVLTNLLEQNMRDKNLLAIKLNLIELTPLTTHRSLHKPLVDEAKALLEKEMKNLDQAADDLYRTEKPLEAYEIWEVLLQLDSSNSAIKQKLERAKKVLDNMKILREQGNTNPLIDSE